MMGKWSELRPISDFHTMHGRRDAVSSDTSGDDFVVSRHSGRLGLVENAKIGSVNLGNLQMVQGQMVDGPGFGSIGELRTGQTARAAPPAKKGCLTCISVVFHKWSLNDVVQFLTVKKYFANYAVIRTLLFPMPAHGLI